MSKYLNIIDQVEVKNPCPIDKSKLRENALGDFCQSCEKQVYNFSKLNRFKILTLLKNDKNICIQIKKDSNGKIITRERLIKNKINKIVNSFWPSSLLTSLFYFKELHAQNEQYFTYEYGEAYMPYDNINVAILFIEGALGALIMLVSFIISILYLTLFYFTKNKTYIYFSVTFFIIAIVAFLVRSIVFIF